jgi:cell division protein FtsB
MSTRQHGKSYLRPLIVPFIAIGFSGYFAWHAWHGSFGIEARRELARQTETVGAELDALKAERATLEHRVELLRANGLESDMLDERAREILGLANPNEIVLYTRATVAQRR